MKLIGVLLAANLLALGGLGYWLYRLQRSALQLRASADWLAADAAALPADLKAQARDAGVKPPFYTIEILNPLEVASQQSKLGKVFGGITPAIVRAEVHRQAHGIIREELERRGIKADVQLHD